VQLLRRTTRRVAVTEAGELVLARGRRSFAEADAVRADLDALRGLLRGSLRLGGVPPIGFVDSVGLIADFVRANPGVDITVRDGAAFAPLAQLRDGAMDLVTALVDPEGLDGLEGIRLLDAELVVATALDHPLAGAKHVRVERLAGEPLITTAAGSALRDTLLALVPGGRVVGEADSLEAVCELTASGLGITLLPRPVVASHADRLAIRPLSPRHALPLSLIWRARERPTPAAQAFREHAISTIRG
jgi:DNA-binding transcriptional LysR family regulator